MKEAFLISFFNTLFLIVWFETNAFIEYFKNFPLIKKVIENYNNMLKSGIGNSFISFLALNYNCFFVRLITCPYCLNFWLSLATSFFVGYEFFAFIYVTSMIYYYLVKLFTSYVRRD